MFAKKPLQPAGQIDLSFAVSDLGDAREVMRVFVGKGDQCVPGVYVNIPDNFTPFMFGILLADLVHHAGKAYAHTFGVDEAAATYEISEGLAAEMRNPTDQVQQVSRESQS